MAKGRYSRIRGSFWTDPDIKRRLSAEQKALLLYYFTTQHGNMAGLFYLPLEYAASETGIDLSDVVRWTEGELSDFVTYDPDTEEIFVHNYARHNVESRGGLKEGDNRVKGVATRLSEVHSPHLVNEFLSRYADWPLEVDERPFEAPLKPLHKGYAGVVEAPSKPRQYQGSTKADTGTKGSSLRSSPSEDEPRVEKPQVEETEPWNARLAPVIREAAYHGDGPPEGHDLSRCLSKAKQLMVGGYSVEDLEDAIRGLRRMAETKHEDVRGWLEPGDRFTVLAFGRAEEKGQKLVQVAAHEWRKRGPPSDQRRRSGPVRVSEVAGGV